MRKALQMAHIRMYHAEWKIITDFKTFNVYRLYTTLGEHGIIHHKTLEQKCRSMADCLAFILDMENIASIGNDRQAF